MKTRADSILVGEIFVVAEHQDCSIDISPKVKEMISRHYNPVNQQFKGLSDIIKCYPFSFDYEDSIDGNEVTVDAEISIEYNNGVIQIFVEHAGVTCTSCKGVGTFECDNCGGEGSYMEECPSCGQDYKQECDECYGSGQIDCEDCGGYGNLDDDYVWENELVGIGKRMLLETINLRQGELF